MPDDVKPKPLANPKFEPFPGWQFGRVSIPGTLGHKPLFQFQLDHIDGSVVKLGPPTADGDGEIICGWLECEGMRDIYDLAISTVEAADGIAAKLAAIGEKAKWAAGLSVRQHDIPPGKPWSVFAGGYFSLSHDTAEAALDEALAHFGLAVEASPPAAPAPEAGLTADHVAALRDFADQVIKYRAAGGADHLRPFYCRPSESVALQAMATERIETWAPQPEPAVLTNEAKLAAIRERQQERSIGVSMDGPKRKYRVELHTMRIGIHFGPEADTIDEAIDAAYRKYVSTPNP